MTSFGLGGSFRCERAETYATVMILVDCGRGIGELLSDTVYRAVHHMEPRVRAQSDERMGGVMKGRGRYVPPNRASGGNGEWGRIAG